MSGYGASGAVRPAFRDVATANRGENSPKTAEGVGFEPTVPIARDSGFQDRRIRPLCHPSELGDEALGGSAR